MNETLITEPASIDPASAAVASIAPSTKPDVIDTEIAKLEASEAGEPIAEAPKPKGEPGISKAAIALRRAQKQAQETKKHLAEVEAKADARAKAAEEKAEQLEALISKLNSTEGLDALLSKAGTDFDALVRTRLGLSPSKQTPEDKITALERRIAEKDIAEKEARAASEKQQAEQRSREAYQRDFKGVSDFVSKNAENFELILDNADRGSINQVISRSNAFLDAKQIDKLSQEEAEHVISHFATEVEAELLAAAEEADRRLSKLKKLKRGIIPHKSSDPNADSIAPKSLEPGSEEYILSQLIDTPSAQPSTKFLTESLLSAPPVSPKENRIDSSTGDEILDRAIEQYRRAQKQSHQMA